MVSWPLGVPSPPCFCHRSVLTEIRAVTSDPSACCCWLIVDVKVTLLILKLHTWADWNLSISSSEPSFFIRTDSREQEVSGQKPTLPARWWGRGRGGWRLGGVGGGSCSDTMSDGKRLILSTAWHTAGIERWLNIDAAGQSRSSCVCARGVLGSMRHYLRLSETFTLIVPVIVSIRDSNGAVVISSLLSPRLFTLEY